MIAIWNFILTGGIVMFPLLISSIIALVLIIEKIITLKKTKIIRPDIIDILSHITNMEDVHLALSFCQKKKGPFANLVYTSLNSLNLESREIKELIADQGRQEIRTLERGLPALETIAMITPILGLLGTVIGMIWVLLIAFCRMIIMKTKSNKNKGNSVAKNQKPTELYFQEGNAILRQDI